MVVCVPTVPARYVHELKIPYQRTKVFQGRRWIANDISVCFEEDGVLNT